MKSLSSLVAAGLVSLGLTACGTARDTSAQAGTTYCFDCHSETTALGQKILWAQSGFATSVHALGQLERVYTQVAPSTAAPGGATNCTPPTTMPATQAACVAVGFTWTSPAGPCTVPATVTQNACESAGGTWLGNKWVLTGTEHTGSNAFYANSGGCQACHTEPGFLKRVSGQYDDPSYNSIKYAWDPKAWVGTPTTTPNTPLTADIIQNPSPIGCFSCHTPHGQGSPDGQSLNQTVPEATVITTALGGVYGGATGPGMGKARGNLCADCHQVTFTSGTPNVVDASTGLPSVSKSILGSAKGGSAATYFGPHHGPQADMLLGKGGAEYSGTAANDPTIATAASVTFAGAYNNSPHSALPSADCVTCHMQSDFEDINVTGNFSVNPAVGGHSFTNKGIVHGVEKALALGCGATTETTACHTVSGIAGSSGNKVVGANVTKTLGYLQAGDAYFQKFNAAADSNYHLMMNELLTKLANPSNSCNGLLIDAATGPAKPAAGKTLFNFATFADGSVDPRCIDNGGNVKPAANLVDNNTDPSVRFLKALWNFKFTYKEDKSFGVHNTKYALELLYDSCTDLAVMTGKPATYCNGTYVTARP